MTLIYLTQMARLGRRFKHGFQVEFLGQVEMPDLTARNYPFDRIRPGECFQMPRVPKLAHKLRLASRQWCFRRGMSNQFRVLTVFAGGRMYVRCWRLGGLSPLHESIHRSIPLTPDGDHWRADCPQCRKGSLLVWDDYENSGSGRFLCDACDAFDGTTFEEWTRQSRGLKPKRTRRS